MPLYENNPAMKQGVIPNQSLVKEEMTFLKQKLHALPIDILEIDFPQSLDQDYPVYQKHDFVFVRDLFISNQDGSIVIAKFREKQREIEAEIISELLSDLGHTIYQLPNSKDCFAEGGEFYYTPNESILFCGISRNSRLGAEKTAELLDVNELVIIESSAFHVDTIFSPILDIHSNLCGLIACSTLMSQTSEESLKNVAKKYSIPFIDIQPNDAIGTDKKLGNFSVNCLSVPGHLIGPARFTTSGVNEILIELEITHHIVSLSQFRLSGGAVHCLTNVL